MSQSLVKNLFISYTARSIVDPGFRKTIALDCSHIKREFFRNGIVQRLSSGAWRTTSIHCSPFPRITL